MGSLARYITEADPNHFQPMNINFGLFPPLETRVKPKRERDRQLAERALESMKEFSSM